MECNSTESTFHIHNIFYDFALITSLYLTHNILSGTTKKKEEDADCSEVYDRNDSIELQKGDTKKKLLHHFAWSRNQIDWLRSIVMSDWIIVLSIFPIICKCGVMIDFVSTVFVESAVQTHNEATRLISNMTCYWICMDAIDLLRSSDYETFCWHSNAYWSGEYSELKLCRLAKHNYGTLYHSDATNRQFERESPKWDGPIFLFLWREIH